MHCFVICDIVLGDSVCQSPCIPSYKCHFQCHPVRSSIVWLWAVQSTAMLHGSAVFGLTAGDRPGSTFVFLFSCFWIVYASFCERLTLFKCLTLLTRLWPLAGTCHRILLLFIIISFCESGKRSTKTFLKVNCSFKPVSFNSESEFIFYIFV